MPKVELKKLKIFEGLDESFFDKLMPHVSIKEFKKGNYLEHEGEESLYFYVVKSGKIAFETNIYNEKTMRLSTVGAGEYFGESSLVPPYETTTSRLAIEDSELYLFEGKSFRQMCENNPAFGYFAMQKIAQMLSIQLHKSRQALLHCHLG